MPANKHENFLQVDSITLVGVARHVQNTQHNCTITLQYLKENLKDEVELVLADKHQRFFFSVIS